MEVIFELNLEGGKEEELARFAKRSLPGTSGSSRSFKCFLQTLSGDFMNFQGLAWLSKISKYYSSKFQPGSFIFCINEG